MVVSYERGAPIAPEVLRKGRSVIVYLPGQHALPWLKAGPPNHHDDKVDSDQ